MFNGLIDYVESFIRRIAPATREEFEQWQRQRQTAQQEALKEEEQRDKARAEVSRQEESKVLDKVRREDVEFEAVRQEALAREQEQSRSFIESLKATQRRGQEELRLQAILRGPGWIQRGWWALCDVGQGLASGVGALIGFIQTKGLPVLPALITYWWRFLVVWTMILIWFDCLGTVKMLMWATIMRGIIAISNTPPNMRYMYRVLLTMLTIPLAFHMTMVSDDYFCIRIGKTVAILKPDSKGWIHPTLGQCRQLIRIPRFYSYGETVAVSILGGTEEVCVGFDLKYKGNVEDIFASTVTETTAETEAKQLMDCLKVTISQHAIKLAEKLTVMNNQQPLVDLRSRWKTDVERQFLKDNLKKELWDIKDECVGGSKVFYAITHPSIQVVGVPVYQ